MNTPKINYNNYLQIKSRQFKRKSVLNFPRKKTYQIPYSRHDCKSRLLFCIESQLNSIEEN